MQEKKAPQEAATPPKAPKRHKILVAEDNPVVRKGLNNFLVKWGYEPIEADNGDTAWNALETDAIHNPCHTGLEHPWPQRHAGLPTYPDAHGWAIRVHRHLQRPQLH